MPRPQRDLKLGYSDRVTTRCNNREFKLTHHECRQFLPKVIKGKGKKASPGQMRSPWDAWEANNLEIVDVAEKFIFANCNNPQVAGIIFRDRSQ